LPEPGGPKTMRICLPRGGVRGRPSACVRRRGRSTHRGQEGSGSVIAEETRGREWTLPKGAKIARLSDRKFAGRADAGAV
jgi:hypothetical protein